MARIVLQELSKVYKGARGEAVYALRGANLTVADREFLVLVGPSGCGKSTALRLIAGLEEVTGGTISIDDRVVNGVAPKDRDVAMVFQNYALYPHMTVYENMAFGLKLRKYARAEVERRVGEAAEILGIRSLLDRLPKALSGGQRQRVAVGRAIVRQPKAFLFDEPLSNLDAQMRVQMRMEICKLHRRLEATMIYVTHDQVEAMTMGDRIVVMKDGVIQQVADPIGLYQAPANLFVAGFIGSPPMNLLRGTLVNQGSSRGFELTGQSTSGPNHGRLSLSEEQALPVARWVGDALVMGVRPEDMHVGHRETRAPGWGTWEATVEMVEPLGAETLVHLVECGQSFVVRSGAQERFGTGDKVWVRVDAGRCHFFDPASGRRIE